MHVSLCIQCACLGNYLDKFDPISFLGYCVSKNCITPMCHAESAHSQFEADQKTHWDKTES